MEDMKLLERLIEEVGDKLWTFCLRLTNDRIVAEDLYQDTMLKAVDLKDKINWDENPAGFLYALAVSINKNSFRRFYRRSRIAPTANIDTSTMNIVGKDNVESKIEASETQKDINIAISKLPLEQRAVILMFYMDDMPIKEIADALKIPIGTVKSRLSIGRNRLKKELLCYI